MVMKTSLSAMQRRDAESHVHVFNVVHASISKAFARWRHSTLWLVLQ